MGYSILRTKKFHHISELAKVGRHNSRMANVPNADKMRCHQNVAFVPCEPNLALRITAKLEGIKRRKDAVIACEVIMTCTAGSLQPERHQEWIRACMDFANEKFGSDNIVQAIAHNDEAAPHLHVIFVPFDERGKLNCRAIFGGPEKMRRLQDGFYEKCGRDFGLSRGIPKSGTEHISMRELYRITEQCSPIEVPLPPDPPSIALGSSKMEYRESARVEQQGVVDRQLEALKKQAERARLAEVKMKQVQLRNSMLSNKAQLLELDLKAERNRLRDLPLNDVAQALGYEGKKEGAKYTRYVTECGDLVIHSDGKFFINGAEKGGKGAINLVMELEGLEFKTAIALLREKFGSQSVTSAALHHFEANVIPTLVAAKESHAPRPLDEIDERQIPNVRNYLIEKRRLSASVVDHLIALGDIAANKFGSVIFCMRDEFGAIKGQIIRATTTAFKGIRKIADCWFGCGAEPEKAKRAILVESPIDALSYPMRDGDAVISFGGANPPETSLRKALQLLRSDCEVVTALDNDHAGQRGNGRISTIAKGLGNPTSIEKPQAKDWNEDLVFSFEANDGFNSQESIGRRI